jgi:hypothetical protein
VKIRERAASFQDYYSRAALFWHSMSDVERAHIVAAYRFELGKVVELLAPTDGEIRTAGGADLAVNRALSTMASVLYDAVLVPCEPDSSTRSRSPRRPTTSTARVARRWPPRSPPRSRGAGRGSATPNPSRRDKPCLRGLSRGSRVVERRREDDDEHGDR